MIVSKMATIIVPLMMLPNRPMASANVRRELADDVERQHDPRRLQVGSEVTAQPLPRDAEDRHRDEHRDRQRSCGRE